MPLVQIAVSWIQEEREEVSAIAVSKGLKHPNRAMWITRVCKNRTREEAVNQRWRLQCLMSAEHKHAGVKQMVSTVAAVNRNVKRRLPPPDMASANNESTGDRAVSST